MTNTGNKNKKIRQSMILEIINTMSISTQDELTERLKESGFDATQATVSRDIRELKLTKTSDKNGSYIYTAGNTSSSRDDGSKYEKILKEAVIGSKVAVNLLVIKTYAGMANAACAAIDRLEWNGIAGSIAGDDTIFIACNSYNDAVKVNEKLTQIL